MSQQHQKPTKPQLIKFHLFGRSMSDNGELVSTKAECTDTQLETILNNQDGCHEFMTENIETNFGIKKPILALVKW